MHRAVQIREALAFWTAQRRDLQFALMEKRNPQAIRPRHIRLCPKMEQQVPPLRYPEFPVQLSGVGELHAAFTTESHIHGLGWDRDVGNPGPLRSG
jgi:hypothetical protein